MGYIVRRAFAARFVVARLPRLSASARLPEIERAPEPELQHRRDGALAYDVNAVLQLLERQPARGRGARGHEAQ